MLTFERFIIFFRFTSSLSTHNCKVVCIVFCVFNFVWKGLNCKFEQIFVSFEFILLVFVGEKNIFNYKFVGIMINDLKFIVLFIFADTNLFKFVNINFVFLLVHYTVKFCTYFYWFLIYFHCLLKKGTYI